MNPYENIRKLVDYLNTCRDQYYNHNNSIITDKQYDELYDELEKLEQETGIVFANSPTQTVGYPIMKGYTEVEHESPLLSLEKINTYSKAVSFCDNKNVLFMWKADGLTVQLIYEDGVLTKATTRGDGIVGQDCTNNAKTFYGVPIRIPTMGHVKITGEAIILAKDFEYINSQLPAGTKEYQNPRNLASGSVKQLNSAVCAERKVQFIVWNANDLSEDGTMLNGLNKAREYGFQIIHWFSNMGIPNTETDIESVFNNMRERAKVEGFPIDGIVLMYNDIEYGKSLGKTSHHYKNGVAFKFYDETHETILGTVEFTIGKTGVFTPTAVFDPVEIDGTEVTRASVHNLTILRQLNLYPGDIVTVYKAKQIIPQIDKNLTEHNEPNACDVFIPDTCPHCGSKLQECRTPGSDTVELYCLNKDCTGRLLKKFEAFVSKNALDIDGLSSKTLEKLVEKGYLVNYSDLWELTPAQIITLEGMGEKSCDNLYIAIDNARNTTLARVLCGLGIKYVGKSVAATLSDYFKNNPQNVYELFDKHPGTIWNTINGLEGFGEALTSSVLEWFQDKQNMKEFKKLASVMIFESPKEKGTKLANMKFVITGSLNCYTNRDALVATIESNGGTVQNSVNKETTYLINNDVNSTSSKNTKAKSLGVSIISEQDFIKMIGDNVQPVKKPRPKKGLF